MLRRYPRVLASRRAPGSCAPVGRERGPGHMIQSRHSIVIHRPAHEVFKYLQDHENRHCWQPNLVSHEKERLARGTKIKEVRNVLGRRIEIEGEITRLDTEIDLELPDLFGLAWPVIQRMTDRELDNAHQLLKDVLEQQHVQRDVARKLPPHEDQRKGSHLRP